jgi:hypothetical protein
MPTRTLYLFLHLARDVDVLRIISAVILLRGCPLEASVWVPLGVDENVSASCLARAIRRDQANATGATN